jgi:HEPN domain-containing protein
MVDKEIIQEWVRKANEDFKFALVNYEERKQFFAQICFHFQQAAEKYLKAYIIANDLDFRKIHDLVPLLKICISKDPSFEKLIPDTPFIGRQIFRRRIPKRHWMPPAESGLS